jgi:hypothetical protein
MVLVSCLLGCIISVYFATQFIPFEKDNCHGYGIGICTYGRIYSVLIIIAGTILGITLILVSTSLCCITLPIKNNNVLPPTPQVEQTIKFNNGLPTTIQVEQQFTQV